MLCEKCAWLLQMVDVSQKLGASLQLGESLVSEKSKPVVSDADPASVSALSSEQTDL